MSKSLISEMLNKISSKTVAEELYPVSEETFFKLVEDLDFQIYSLDMEIEKR